MDNKSGVGTTFSLSFLASYDRCEPAHENEPSCSSAKLAGLVLVIDDEEPMREAITEILASEGVQTLTATNGLEGLALYREHREAVRLIILDLSMPGLDGEATLMRLREINPEAPVVLSSGYSEAEMAARCGGLDFVSILPKPYRWNELVKIVASYLSKNGRFCAADKPCSQVKSNGRITAGESAITP